MSQEEDINVRVPGSVREPPTFDDQDAGAVLYNAARAAASKVPTEELSDGSVSGLSVEAHCKPANKKRKREESS
ncbi:predicted protein [Coccidioides posadasii str. Silveira]|uniref:Predicted protein n=1 Tax=Coccidioides posadasii (strain RMSCC 757 / Silveira) TaxID=443226 RepID=E9D527_COCPS|nr:predicted protein [Coccidioides posadasii str. Silveira]